MPVDKPKQGESKDKYLSYCIPAEIEAGYEVAQATAICISTYDRDNMKKIKSTDKKVMARIKYDTEFRGINLAPLEKGPNDPCWEGYVQVGTKDMDGREVPNCVPLSKIEMDMAADCMCNLAEYPWEQCIEDQMKRYENKDIAEAVCGMIRSKYGS
jgi:hypothetical protein